MDSNKREEAIGPRPIVLKPSAAGTASEAGIGERGNGQEVSNTRSGLPCPAKSRVSRVADPLAVP